MREFRKILVGVDLDPKGRTAVQGSRQALRQARWLAHETGGELVLLHSTWTDAVTEPLGGAATLVSEGVGAAERAGLEELVDEVRAEGLRAELVITRERPWLAITHAALRGEADVVLVGKRNEESNEGRYLGSVAIKLLRKCPSPVWVVKPEHDLVHKLVLSATDLTPVGDQAVRFGGYVAQCHECELHVVHAYQIPLQLQMESSSLSEEDYAARIEAIKRNAQESIATALGGIELARPAEVHVGRNTPSRAIKEAVEHLHPDLLVMGTISRGGVAGMLVGNTAEKLIERVDCSILAVKPEDFISPVTL